MYDRLGSQHPEEAPPETEDMSVYPYIIRYIGSFRPPSHNLLTKIPRPTMQSNAMNFGTVNKITYKSLRIACYVVKVWNFTNVSLFTPHTYTSQFLEKTLSSCFPFEWKGRKNIIIAYHTLTTFHISIVPTLLIVFTAHTATYTFTGCPLNQDSA